MEQYWEARWDYAEPYRQKIAPYPNVHLSFRGGRADVNGVCSVYQIKVLEGRGHVFGVAFRPGCFRPFLGAAVSTITDKAYQTKVLKRYRVTPGPHGVSGLTEV